ncbi:MAG: AAA family ATPase [Nitrospirae bacterium]|nr:AAA family ATPase [Nitrospirota bacterium]
MAQIIAFSGKGGTGKTTLAGMAVRYLMEKTGRPILAVDADANACLNEALGVTVHATIGRVREQSLATIRSGARPGGLSTEEHFDYQVQQSIVESRGFDLLVMGRPEGQGCYCAANNIIRKYTDKLADDYAYVVIDNEAGMEHLSRRTAQKINVLFIVSDPTLKGIRTVNRINELIVELSLEIDKRYVIFNRVKSGDDAVVRAACGKGGLALAGTVPEDVAIYNLDLHGDPVFGIPSDAPSLKAFYGLLDNVLMAG